MSDVSSSPDQPAGAGPAARRPLTAWWLAPIAIAAVGFIYFASQIVGGVIVLSYANLQHLTNAQTNDWLNNSVLAQFFYILIAETLTMLGLWFMLKAYRWTWATIGLVRPRLKNILWGLSAVIPYYILYIIVVTVVSAVIPSLQVDQKQEIGFDSVHGAAALALTFVSLVILPPLVEEIAMRGFLFTSLKKWLSRVTAALVVSILFGAAHLTEGGAAGPLWIGAIDTFLLSLILCYLRERTGNLWAGITLHAAKNGVAFVSLFILSTH